jgi:hypothetical protein
MASTKPDFLGLPPELLLEICDYLPPDAILSLKLTHSILNHTLPILPRLRNKTLSECSRFAIERLRISPNAPPAAMRCMICKRKYPLNMFISSSSPACEPRIFFEGVPRLEVVDLPPFFCAWHVGRLARVIRTEPGGRNEWVSDLKRICMHDGIIQGWAECDCDCDSCGYRTVRTYTRYLNNNVQCRRFTFWRDLDAGESDDPQENSKGRLYVKETCWHGKSSAKGNLPCPWYSKSQD